MECMALALAHLIPDGPQVDVIAQAAPQAVRHLGRELQPSLARNAKRQGAKLKDILQQQGRPAVRSSR